MESSDLLASMVNEAVAGDRRAVERLLASVRPLVSRYCRARVGRTERAYASADDVAQEVCLAVLTALPTYREQGRPFLAFVYGIAAHKVADAHRVSARNRSEPVAEVPDGPPRQFRWRRILHDVARMEGPERIAPEWWRRREGAGKNGGLTRDYYRIEDVRGRRFWIFRHGLYDEADRPAWYVHGLFA